MARFAGGTRFATIFAQLRNQSTMNPAILLAHHDSSFSSHTRAPRHASARRRSSIDAMARGRLGAGLESVLFADGAVGEKISAVHRRGLETPRPGALRPSAGSVQARVDLRP